MDGHQDGTKKDRWDKLNERCREILLFVLERKRAGEDVWKDMVISHLGTNPTTTRKWIKYLKEIGYMTEEIRVVNGRTRHFLFVVEPETEEEEADDPAQCEGPQCDEQAQCREETPCGSGSYGILKETEVTIQFSKVVVKNREYGTQSRSPPPPR